ncbi:MAG: hypothetical protein M3301_00540 [Chloroflexota bacterium]|nr:hypothetical protein [Chloroflexota bacterium]
MPEPRAVASISVDGAPHGLATTKGAVWVAQHRGRKVARIDTAANRVAASVPVVGGQPGRMTTTEGALWLALYGSNKLVRIDPERNEVVATIELPGELCCGLASGAGAVWAVAIKVGEADQFGASETGLLVRIDARTNRVLGTVPLGTAPGGVVFGGGAVWAAGRGRILRIDPAANRVVTSFPLPGRPAAFGAGGVWIAGLTDGSLARIDPRTNQVATIHLPGAGDPSGEIAGFIAVADGFDVWVASDGSSSLWRVDAGAQVAHRAPLKTDVPVADLVFADGTLWASLFDTNTVVRIDPGSE